MIRRPGLRAFSSLNRPLFNVSTTLRPVFIRPRTRVQTTPVTASTQHFRFYSPLTTDEPAKDYDYKLVKKIALGGEPGTVLVDVREPNEYEQGHIPTAVNIPVNSTPGALGLDAEDFFDTFGFEKPDTDKNLVFYCLAGIRSASAEKLAATYGYQHRGNYKGSWQDWVDHESSSS